MMEKAGRVTKYVVVENLEMELVREEYNKRSETGAFELEL